MIRLIFISLFLIDLSSPALCIYDGGDDYSKLLSLIQRNHVSPPKFDRDFSEKVFYNFIKRIDPNMLYFDSIDIIKFSAFKYNLFETPNNPNTFIKTLEINYQNRVRQFDSICNIMLLRKLDFQKKEYFKIYNTNNWTINGYFSKPASYINNWVKFKVLQQMEFISDLNDSSGLSAQNIFKYEENARNMVLKQSQIATNTILKSDNDLEDFLSISFKRALLNSLDPHSEYFSTKEKNSFEASLSSSQLTFGFQTTVNEAGELVIVGIIPGSSAWKCNQLHKGDVITSIVIQDKNTINIAEADIDEVIEIINSEERLSLGFTIRRKDGQLETINLIKTNIKQDESIVKSYILNGKIKVGYIVLPDFYTEFENNYEYGCANDVAKAIMKLKKENIQGLIIDLRDNGGGSVREAVDLSGIFIDYGPICTVVDNGGKAITYKDFNRGVIYSDPLVIMVNKQSASASELFASSMQDYNRALIVGSSTYGKATSQAIIPCDSVAMSKGKVTDYLKLTVQKIYRITNKNNQNLGLTPDILLPDLLDSLPFGEKSELSSLKFTSIDKKLLYTKLKELPISTLKEQSSIRVKDNIIFASIKILSDSIYHLYYYDLFNLSPDIQSFPAIVQRQKQITSSLKQNCLNIKSEYSVKSNDIGLTSTSDSNYNFILKDIDLQETYNVLNDLCNSNNQ
jgi:carboxyl-terminal processing protease